MIIKMRLKKHSGYELNLLNRPLSSATWPSIIFFPSSIPSFPFCSIFHPLLSFLSLILSFFIPSSSYHHISFSQTHSFLSSIPSFPFFLSSLSVLFYPTLSLLQSILFFLLYIPSFAFFPSSLHQAIIIFLSLLHSILSFIPFFLSCAKHTLG